MPTNPSLNTEEIFPPNRLFISYSTGQFYKNTTASFLLKVLFIILFSLMHSYAQESRVLTEVSEHSTALKPIILIKWYSPDLMYPEGVNLYRREQGTLNWTKINTTPIIKSTTVAPSVLLADPEMEDFIEIIKTATPDQLKEEMLLFNILVKSFQSNIFADLMGIFYEDNALKNGVIYEYKVSKLKAGKEIIIGISNPVTAETYKPSLPIKNIEIFQDGKRINLNWLHEEERYYAINIYRKSYTDSAFTRLNTKPIVLTQSPDSTGKLAYAKPMFSENLRLKEGEVYYYQLTGLGFFEKETAPSDPIKVEFKDVTPPPAPKNFEAKADSMKIRMKWENVPASDIKELRIYRSIKSDGPYAPVANGTLPLGTTLWVDTVSVPGPYYYFIASVDNAGNEGHSNLMFVDVQDVMPPAKPLSLTIQADTGKILLAWKKGHEQDLAGYYIYRTVDTHQKKNYVLLNAEPLNADKFEQQLPKNVKNKFFYFVVAVDTSYNRSTPSDFVSAKMPDIVPPEKPFIKDIVYNGYITVEWIQNVDHDLIGYHLYRSDTTKNFSRVNINMLGRETYKFVDRSAAANTDYFYYLVASDSAGNLSPASKQVYARRVVNDLPPDRKLTLKIKNKKKKKTSMLEWNEIEIETPIAGYVVFRGESKHTLKPITGLIKEKNFTDTKGNSKVYYYQVRAYAGSRVFQSEIIK